jgi:hypothetical protein
LTVTASPTYSGSCAPSTVSDTLRFIVYSFCATCRYSVTNSSSTSATAANQPMLPMISVKVRIAWD